MMRFKRLIFLISIGLLSQTEVGLADADGILLQHSGHVFRSLVERDFLSLASGSRVLVRVEEGINNIVGLDIAYAETPTANADIDHLAIRVGGIYDARLKEFKANAMPKGVLEEREAYFKRVRLLIESGAIYRISKDVSLYFETHTCRSIATAPECQETFDSLLGIALAFHHGKQMLLSDSIPIDKILRQTLDTLSTLQVVKNLNIPDSVRTTLPVWFQFKNIKAQAVLGMAIHAFRFFSLKEIIDLQAIGINWEIASPVEITKEKLGHNATVKEWKTQAINQFRLIFSVFDKMYRNKELGDRDLEDYSLQWLELLRYPIEFAVTETDPNGGFSDTALSRFDDKERMQVKHGSIRIDELSGILSPRELYSDLEVLRKFYDDSGDLKSRDAIVVQKGMLRRKYSALASLPERMALVVWGPLTDYGTSLVGCLLLFIGMMIWAVRIEWKLARLKTGEWAFGEAIVRILTFQSTEEMFKALPLEMNLFQGFVFIFVPVFFGYLVTILISNTMK